MYNHSEFGLWGEKQAQKHLKKKGLKILETNYETKFGEVDVICLQTKASATKQAKKFEKAIEKAHGKDRFDLHKRLTQKQFERADNVLVFVEVKSRSKESANVVEPNEAVDAKKQSKYASVAKVFASSNEKFAKMPWRFDIVEVVEDCGKAKLNHIECAF